MNWYYATKDEQQIGPVDDSAIPALIKEGTITIATPVWSDGMPDWALVSQTVLSVHFPKQPPKLPPPIKTNPSTSEVISDIRANIPRITDKVVGHITNFAGVERLDKRFSIKEVFSEAFKKHPRDEVEEYFAVGTPNNTPGIDQIDPCWPKPWIFLRTLSGALIIYGAFLLAWNMFQNINLVPGLIMIGSFAVPLATLVFFIEMNARRNVSLYQIIRLVFAGGILALVLSLLLSEVADFLRLSWLGASVAGLVEEPGKLLALLAVARIPKYHYRLNGILFGAAVGTGFAAFESAGYALRMGLLVDTDIMKDTIIIRGLLSPCSHIAWTAICAAGIWRVKGKLPFHFAMLSDIRFLRLFGSAVILHMIWNSPIYLPLYAKYIILGIVAWVIILSLIQDGLKELRDEKNGAKDPSSDSSDAVNQQNDKP